MESSGQLNYKSLARSIESGKCILVLGGGVSTSTDTDGHETPLHLMLSRLLWERLERGKDEIDPDDIRHVSQALYDQTGAETDLQMEVGEFYAKFAGSTTQLHRDLAALPFKLCITLGPDDYLFNAFREAGKDPQKQYYDFRTPRLGVVSEPTVQSPLVYHLYGYREPPESQVITESDLIDFLTRVVKNDPPLPDYIRATLSKKESACLFAGLEFKQWYLRVLMHVLGYHDQHTNRSWALEGPDFFNKRKQHHSIAYFSSRKTINFHDESLGNLLRRLRAAHAEIAGPDGPGRMPARAAADAPLVFLSYASEDRAAVDDLHSRIESAGIKVWQDKDDLRGGDNWELQLKHVVGKVADYVVVVQTPNMLSRIEGVFNMEIHEALTKQDKMPRFRFVIPVHTRENCLMPQFEREKLHTTPVVTEANVKALAATILEDWAARKNLRLAAVA